MECIGRDCFMLGKPVPRSLSPIYLGPHEPLSSIRVRLLSSFPSTRKDHGVLPTYISRGAFSKQGSERAGEAKQGGQFHLVLAACLRSSRSLLLQKKALAPLLLDG